MRTGSEVRSASKKVPGRVRERCGSPEPQQTWGLGSTGISYLDLTEGLRPGFHHILSGNADLARAAMTPHRVQKEGQASSEFLRAEVLRCLSFWCGA